MFHRLDTLEKFQHRVFIFLSPYGAMQSGGFSQINIKYRVFYKRKLTSKEEKKL